MRHALNRPAAALAAAAFVLGLATRALAAPPAVTAEEYRLHREYEAALGDERVQKLPEKKRLGAIAKNFKVSEKKLQALLDKADVVKGAPAACEPEVRALVDAGPLKGRLTELRVDATEPLVVTYLAWKNADGAKLEEEAATLALAASKGAPITSTIALWAVDAASGRKVFEARINAETASRFQQERIPMFAAARYIKQFDGVKNAYKGSPPEAN